ncbi:MAG TPA: CRISPR-associated helicase Cas3' [Acidobacteriaceae bacterium]|nr:CRISPR-associated helicase Cas3' [Acidobacteriaceae bacterium]
MQENRDLHSKYSSQHLLKPIAHVHPNHLQITHSLEEHLSAVAQLTEKMSAEFGAAEWGSLAGRWHDLGKFSQAFQQYIRCASGYEAHLVDATPGRVNHSSAGALHAKEAFGYLGLPLAYLIAGHHAGLPDWYGDASGSSSLESRLQRGHAEDLLQQATKAVPDGRILKAQRPTLNPEQFGGAAGLHLWIRMLFSCLTDADFLDTEAFMDMGKSEQRGNYPALTMLLTQFDEAMEQKAQAERTPVNQIRADVLRQCREKSSGAPGLYTLTVPTGGGKTLSSLAFALEHAIRYDKRRIIYAIPYTSIIEQTADVFRDAFGDAVLEHHSNLDSEKETARSRLASENWDAPLVVTTNVQLFESLFAARTSRCRKLHNLVNSVIILDEAQLLPPEFLQPILDVMRLLTEHYGVTFVLCTATQPALDTRPDSFGKTLLRGPGDATEIVSGTEQLYKQLERVTISLPQNWNASGNWDEIADRIASHPSVLAIVNTRADCRELHRRMPAGTVHLSALMCGEHRSYVIKKIKERLPEEAVRVISTQLIEAGVDVDFPVVYRALAGLDSIAQAAGRCNREGKQTGKGQVIVFIPPTQAPPGLLRFGEDACRIVLHERPENPLTPDLFKSYFTHYYSKVGEDGLDKHGIEKLMTQDAAQCRIQFRAAAKEFQLIEEDGSVAVIVPYANPEDARRDSRPLIARLRSGELHRGLLRELQRFTVMVRMRNFNMLCKSGELEELAPGLWVLKNETAYHGELGLLAEKTGNPDPEQLYC